MSRPVDVLEVILRHADSHRSNAVSDAYSAQEAPKLEAAYSAVAELMEAASQIRTTLSLTRSNVLTEIKRGATQWEGVPELLQARIETFDATLARVRGAA